VTYVDTTVTALGVTRRAVLTHSKTLHAKQSRGFDQTLAKARRRLTELQTRLARGKTRRDRDAVQAEIAAICRPRWVSEVITTTFTGKDLAELRLTWRTDTRARQRLKNRIFGKRILFTNRDEWPVTDVITGYRSQSEVESAIRQMKDPHVVSFSPMHHWTDSKIRVHVFYCVLAPRHRPPHATRSPPGRPAHVRTRTPQHPRRHPRNRPALPRRRQRPPPEPDA
jgi:transposase